MNIPTVAPSDPDALLTVKQVAALLATSTRSVWRLRDSGELRAVKMGTGTIRFRRADVVKLLDDSTECRRR